MIPRIFVSSTYYDLKHVRERLEKFIDNYGFEPILFESDKVTYEHGKELDTSAYFEVSLCHMMVLIVGGRYGAPSSIDKAEEERKKYDEDYISITRKEFDTAIKKDIPILIFVDRNVYAEYQTYKENQDFFEDLNTGKSKTASSHKKFKFAHVDNVNIFKFIDILRSKPIKTFEKVEEIETYIKSQLSGMFFLYLESLQKKSNDKKILDTVQELNNITSRMNEMLTSVGKEILGKDQEEFQKVIDSQFAIVVKYFVGKFRQVIEFDNAFTEEELDKIDLDSVTRIIYSMTIQANLPIAQNKKTYDELILFNSFEDAAILGEVNKVLGDIDSRIYLKRYEFRYLNYEFHSQVQPFVTDISKESLLLNAMKDVIRSSMDLLPF